MGLFEYQAYLPDNVIAEEPHRHGLAKNGLDLFARVVGCIPACILLPLVAKFAGCVVVEFPLAIRQAFQNDRVSGIACLIVPVGHAQAGASVNNPAVVDESLGEVFGGGSHEANLSAGKPAIDQQMLVRNHEYSVTHKCGLQTPTN